MALDLVQNAVLIQDADWQERINLLCIWPIPCSCGMCFFNCCEKENTYTLLYSDEQYENLGQTIFRFKEEKPFFFKKCCFPPSHRPFELSGENVYKDVCITVERPYQCTLFCLARPEIKINYKSLFIGKIIEPIQCSIPRCVFHELKVYDKNGSLTYTIKASLCQCNTLCQLGLISGFHELVYGIFDRDGELVGQISHLFGGFKRECCSKADKYGIQFPLSATVEEKILLTVAMIFIDYLLFENV